MVDAANLDGFSTGSAVAEQDAGAHNRVMNSSLRRHAPLWFAAAASVALVTAMIPLRTFVANTNLALVLVLGIFGAAAVGGRGCAVASAVFTAFAYDFFLTRPYESLTISRNDDIVTTALLLSVGVAAGSLVERAKRHAAAAGRVEAELARIHRRTELAAGGETPGRLIRLAGEELSELFDLKSWRYRPGREPLDLPVLGHDSIQLPERRDQDRRGQLVIPVRSGGRSVGHFVLVFPSNSVGLDVPVGQRQAAVLVADQLASALGSAAGPWRSDAIG